MGRLISTPSMLTRDSVVDLKHLRKKTLKQLKQRLKQAQQKTERFRNVRWIKLVIAFHLTALLRGTCSIGTLRGRGIFDGSVIIRAGVAGA